MVHLTTEKNPPESPPLQHPIFVQIQNGGHYTGVHFQMDLVKEVSDLELCFRWHFLLIEGWSIVK